METKKIKLTQQELNQLLEYQDVKASKTLGWKCELCGARSRKPRSNGRYKHGLYQRAMWHLKLRCKGVRFAEVPI